MGDVVVTVRQGALRGLKSETYKGDTFYSFKGIPYAKPPLGKLRFRAPQPADPWRGILDATQHRDKCSQFDIFQETPTLVGSEDCLYLNVYTLEDPREANGREKPVMFYIHGGGFTTGSGNSDEYGPDYLITENVVLVTFNYRLGIFGFLRADDKTVGIPGNAGMKDIVQALRWVRGNISRFGGDANNVTIFGENSGGTAVHYLMLSPLAKGLFHQAIIQNGSALDIGALVDSDTLLHGLAKVQGIISQDEKIIMHEIKNLSTEEIQQAQLKLRSEFGDVLPFAPTIEKPSNESAFLSEHPLNIIRSGNFNQVPTIFGYTSREGSVAAQLDEKLATREYGDFVPSTLNHTDSSPKFEEVTRKIGQFLSDENSDISFKIYNDIKFLYGIYAAIKETIKVSPETIYLYRFSLEGKNSVTTLNSTLPGTPQGDDVPYLFRTERVPLQLNPNSLEDRAVKRYTRLFANFAKYGNPNSKAGTNTIDVEWRPVQQDRFNFLDFGENLSVGVNPDWKRVKFWEEILNTN